MGFPLGSQELAHECLRRQEVDNTLKEKLKGLTFNLIMVFTDAPGNEDRQLEIILKNGKFISVVARSEPAPSSELRSTAFDKEKFDAKGIGDHQTFYDLVSGKLHLLEALKKVNIVGDFGKLMLQLSGFLSFIEFLGSMDIEP